MTNVVNLSPKTAIFNEKAIGLTTFVTTTPKSTRKTPWIDDVCNNTHRATHQRPGPTGAEGGGTGGPGCGARGRRQGLAGLRDDAPISDQAPLVWRAPEGPEGQAAVPVGGGGAWPGFETTRRAKLAARTASGRAAAHGHTKQPGPAGHTKQPGPAREARRSSPSEPCARAGASRPGRSGCGPRCAAPRLRCR